MSTNIDLLKLEIGNLRQQCIEKKNANNGLLIINNKIKYYNIIMTFSDIIDNNELNSDSKILPIINDIIILAKNAIINNVIDSKNEFSFSKYNDDELIYIYEKLAEKSDNKLLNFFRFLNIEYNLEDLGVGYKDLPQIKNQEEIFEYYYYLNKKEEKDNFFDKYKIETYKEIELLRENLNEITIKDYYETQKKKLNPDLTESNKDKFNKLLENGKITFPFDNIKNKCEFPIITSVYQNLKKK